MTLGWVCLFIILALMHWILLEFWLSFRKGSTRMNIVRLSIWDVGLDVIHATFFCTFK